MTHWGWYWKIKKKNMPRRLCCSNTRLHEIDSFSMYNKYYQIELVRASADKSVLYIPRYNLKAYLQDDDSLLVKFQQGSYVIPLEKMPCNYGGHYYFFHCPCCNKRMRKLYCLEGRYICRSCGNLAYYTQRVRPSERFLLMEMDVKKYVKNRGGALKIWNGNFIESEKPPRMHRRTFQKLKDRAVYYEAKNGQALNKELRSWYGSAADMYRDEFFEYEWEIRIKEYEKKYLKKKRAPIVQIQKLTAALALDLFVVPLFLLWVSCFQVLSLFQKYCMILV